MGKLYTASVTEAVTSGHTSIGTIEGKTDGYRAFGPSGENVGTFDTIAAARRALFQLHQDSQAALIAAQ